MKKFLKIFSAILIITVMLGVQLPTAVLAKEAAKAVSDIKAKQSKKANKIKREDLYEKGQVVVMYKNDFKSNVKSKSLLNDLKVEDTVEFKKETEENKKRMASIKEKNTQNTKVSLISSKKYSTEELVKKLKKEDGVLNVQPNYKVKASDLTNDTYEKYQWAIENKGQNAGYNGEADNMNKDINPILPAETDSKEEKVIAIIDTGVDYANSELSDIMWNNPYGDKLPGTHGYDFVNDDEEPIDDDSHGTHCAGIIAAKSNNEKGITGATLGAENVKIMALKFLDEEGNGSLYNAIKAYNYIYLAQVYGTNVVAINNSWGGYSEVTYDENSEEEIFKRIIDLVGEKGAISVCAAGNDEIQFDENGTIREYDFWSGDEITLRNIPGGIKSNYSITVAASNEYDELAGFSNYGGNIDIAAPGTDILSTVSTPTLNPSIYTEDQINELCAQYESFDNGPVEHCITDGEANRTELEYFGTHGDSLKWTVKGNGETHYLAIPIKEGIIDEEDYYSLLSAKVKAYKTNSEENDEEDFYSYNSYNIGVSNVNYEDIKNNFGMESYNSLFFGYEAFNSIYDNEIPEKGNYWTSINEIAYLSHMKSFIIAMETTDDNADYTIYIDDLAIGRKAYNKVEKYNEEYDEYYDDFEGNAEYLEKLGKYDFYNGTSMATPYVTAAVAVAANKYSSDDVIARKTRILSSARYSEDLDGRVETSGTIDLDKINEDPENAMVKPEITSINMSEDGTITVTGKNFGSEPKLYINNILVKSSYDKKAKKLTYKNSVYANRTVSIRVENKYYSDEFEQEFLSVGKELDKEKINLNYAEEIRVTTDGSSSIVYAGGDLYKITQGKDGISYKKLNNLRDCGNKLFEDFNSAFNDNYIELFSDLQYANGKVYAIIEAWNTIDVSRGDTIIAYCDINGEDTEWKKLSLQLPDNIYYDASFAMYNGIPYIIGGSAFDDYNEEYDDYNYSGPSKKVYKYNETENKFEETVSLPEGRESAKSIQVKDKLIVMLGYDGTEFTPATLIFDGKEWKKSNATIEASRDYSGLGLGLVSDGVLVTGVNAEGIGNTFIYNVNKDKYESTGYKADDTITSTVVNDKLYSFGGYEEAGKNYLYTMPLKSGLLTIKANNSEGTTLEYDNRKYLPGEKVTITAKVNDGYTLKAFKVNGKDVNGMTYEGNITDNLNVTLEATKNAAQEEQNKDVAKMTVSGIKDLTYTGQQLTQKITITNGNATLREGIDYYLEYSNNINSGKASIKIYGIGQYNGTTTRTFNIIPKKVTGVKNKKQNEKSITVKWTGIPGATGYELQKYNGKKWKTVTSNAITGTSYKVTGLNAGTTYKFRVKAYVTIDKKNYYGKYSKECELTTATAAPKLSKVTAGSKKATVQWKKTSGATGYEVYMSTKKGGGYKNIKTLKKAKKVKYTKQV